MELFGGTVVPFDSIAERLRKDAAKLPNAELLFTIPRNFTQFKNALVFNGDTTIDDDGSWIVDTEQKWLKKHKVSHVVCFGNLTVKGDFTNADEKFWPVVYIGGTLEACNMLKGGAPLLVRDDLRLSGYYLGEYNDGPLRVGGNFCALGYIPLARDQKEAKAHLILGSMQTTKFDGTAGFSSEDLRRAVSDERVLSYRWFDQYRLFQRGREGVSIWRTEDQPFKVELKEPPPPIPSFEPVDPRPFGVLVKPADVRDKVEKLIYERIEHNPDTWSYPAQFAEFTRIHFDDYARWHLLEVPPGTTITGDLLLDWEAEWSNNGRVSGIICSGDLTVEGTIRNTMLEGGPLLFVGGNLRTKNLIKGGAPVIVLGDVTADGLVVGEYNDGVMRIGGDLHAAYYILLDHDGFVRGKVHAQTLNEDQEDFVETMVQSVFSGEYEESPDVNLLWAHQAAGRPILRDTVGRA